MKNRTLRAPALLLSSVFALSLAPLALGRGGAIDPVAQQAYLKASNAEAGDEFGRGVAISGDTLVVGAHYEASGASGVDGDQSDNSMGHSGAAYVFVRDGATWSQQAYLKPSNPVTSAQFGRAVAISGDTIVVGAHREAGIDDLSGAAYVFVRNGTTWSEQAYLKASYPDYSDSFGASVAISGERVVVGAPFEASAATGVNGDETDNSAPQAGAAYVFARSGTTWSQEAYLKASSAESFDNFGNSVAISGDLIAVGAYHEDSAETGVNGDESDDSAEWAGAAYVFAYSGGEWAQEAYLKASNTDIRDYFGSTVSLSGNTLAVTATGEDSNATGVNGDQSDNSILESGACYVFTRDAGAWSQEAYLKASNPRFAYLFGEAAALSGDRLLIGSWREGSDATGVNGDDNTNNDAPWSGAAYLFARSGTSWAQEAYLKASNAEQEDRFAISVGISGDTAVVGSYNEDSNATGVGGDQGDNSAEWSGAAYVFDLDPDELGARYCTPAVPNSSGQPGVTTVFGSATVSDDYLLLGSSDLPTGPNIGYFIMGTGMNTFTPPGSSGPICVAPGIKRYLGPVNNTNELEGGFLRVTGTSGSVSSSITPGSTWNFQAWHRDGMDPSNLTDAVSVVFN